jgi:FtsP/CotA-like multicopper oxidase with cupredoxin domain
MNRREFLKQSAAASVGESPLGVSTLLPAFADEGSPVQGRNLKLRISPVSLNIGPGKTIQTVGYSGSVPGPILRFREGKPVAVDVYNDTDVPEVVHWHGQAISPKVDGSVEEGHFRFPPMAIGSIVLLPIRRAHAGTTRIRWRTLI